MEEKIQFAVKIMLLIFLGIAAYFDCRRRRIPWSILGMGAVFMIICNVMQWREFRTEIFWAVAPGLLLLLLARITGENIGYGDGISVLLVGGMAGIRNCIGALCVSLLLLSLVALVLLVIKRADRKTKIPYLPFLFAAEGVLIACNFT